MSTGGSLDETGGVVEKELEDGAIVCLKQGLFDVTDRGSTTGTCASAHTLTFNLEEVRGVKGEVGEGEDMLHYAEESVS